MSGAFRDGIFCNGTFHDGMFRDGTFCMCIMKTLSASGNKLASTPLSLPECAMANFYLYVDVFQMQSS